MKKFAFIPGQSLGKTYTSLLLSYKKKDSLLDIFKIGVLFFAFLLSIFIYLYFVSRSSTSGYFLRKENQKLSAISFQYEILKTQILDQHQKNWNSLEGSSFSKKEVETIYLPSFSGNIFQDDAFITK